MGSRRASGLQGFVGYGIDLRCSNLLADAAYPEQRHDRFPSQLLFRHQQRDGFPSRRHDGLTAPMAAEPSSASASAARACLSLRDSELLWARLRNRAQFVLGSVPASGLSGGAASSTPLARPDDSLAHPTSLCPPTIHPWRVPPPNSPPPPFDGILLGVGANAGNPPRMVRCEVS